MRMPEGILRHVRLFGSLATGIVLFLVLPPHWSAINRVLIGWNSGVLLFLSLVFLWMRRLTATQICERYIEEDETAPVILVAVICAALLSLIAIVAVLSTIRQLTGVDRNAHFALSALTIVSSWILVPTMFTLHYADLFYSVGEDERPLEFPRTSMLVFWDFAYFSFTIAAACQTSDIPTTGTAIRKVVLAQTLIAFLFNASILGFAINITAGVMAGN